MKIDIIHLIIKWGAWLLQLLRIENSELNLDYATTEVILGKIEKYVYGEYGFIEYEKKSPPELQRLLRRSFAQFLAQKEIYNSKLFNFIKDLICSIIIIPFVIFASILGIFLKRGKYSSQNVVHCHYDYRYLRDMIKNLYCDNAPTIVKYLPLKLGWKDVSFIFKCIQTYPCIVLHPHFMFSLIKWISYYSGTIYVFNPKTICNFFEGSFVSSIITYYVRSLGIIHINYMHGERFFSPRFSFCEFDIFYVYGEYWINLFKQLNCKSNFVTVSNPYHREIFALRSSSLHRPERLLILHSRLFRVDSNYYYLLLKILKCIPKNWEIQIRFHPIEKEYGLKFFEYLKKDCLKMGLKLKEDEHQSSSLDRSLSNSKVVVGFSTAALFEGYISGSKVIYLIKKKELEDRYKNSGNILFVDEYTPETEIKEFLITPIIINEYENSLVNYLTKVF